MKPKFYGVEHDLTSTFLVFHPPGPLPSLRPSPSQAADLADVSSQLGCHVRCVARGRDGLKEVRLLVAVVGP